MSNSEQSTSSTNYDDGLSVSTTGEITVAAVTFLVVLFLVILVLYIRTKRYWIPFVDPPRSRRLVFADPISDGGVAPRRGLDLTVLKTLPVTVFRSEDFEAAGGLECAVCLSDLVDGEEARLLPKCNHGFHVECIDMWFQSNSTCPLCRLEVMNSHNSLEVMSSSSSERMLVIEIPRRLVLEGFSSSSNSPLESVMSPVLERLRSVRRILSGRGSVGNSSCSPKDCEQGVPAVSPEVPTTV